MNFRNIVVVFLVVGSFFAINTTPSFAAPEEDKLTGRQIMEKQKDLHKVSSEFEFQKMVLVDKTGSKETRDVRRYIKENEVDVFRSLIVFLQPSDIKGTALLNWQHKDRADDQWLYLPAQGKMQRIAKGGGRNYFMGTDFTYEDMQSEEFDDYKYTLLKEEPYADEGTCYVVEAIPANKEKERESGYSKRIMWLRKDIFLTVKIDFYDRRKKLIKTQTNSAIENVKGTIWRAKKALMDNHKAKHKTAIMVVKREVNEEIPDKTFTERFILKGEHTQ
tara:strand:+ start:152 stop:979 length:828 start_codon:yes stop_codon:yes gene_type:complete